MSDTPRTDVVMAEVRSFFDPYRKVDVKLRDLARLLELELVDSIKEECKRERELHEARCDVADLRDTLHHSSEYAQQLAKELAESKKACPWRLAGMHECEAAFKHRMSLLPQGPTLSGIQDTSDTVATAGSALPKGGQ